MKASPMEVLQYCNTTWIRSSKLYELHKLPYLIVNDKAFYEAKAYFKEKYGIEVYDAGLQSTDDHGVALIVYLQKSDVDFDILNNMSNDLFRIGVEETCDDCGHICSYLKLYFSINQEMENV